ncbi:MAG: SDR family oxidoreductase [Nocardioides sp.]
MRTLDGKVVVITGAGSGIGRALAVEVGGRGGLLALSDVDEVGLAETARLATAAGAREVRTDRLDVADRAAVAAYAREVAGNFDRVHVLVNNAGVSLSGDVADLSYADLDWIVGVNFWGVVHGTKEFLPHLIASGDGHVVTISSLFGLVSMPGQGAYNATKYAVRGFTEALREEMLVAGHPVGVTVVHPGGIKTAIARNARVAGDLDAAELARHSTSGSRGWSPSGRLDHRRRDAGREGAGAGGTRRPRAAPRGQAARVALPGPRGAGSPPAASSGATRP